MNMVLAKLAAMEAEMEMLKEDAKHLRETEDDNRGSAVVNNHSLRQRAASKSVRGDTFHRMLKSKSKSKKEETCPLVEEDCNALTDIASCLEDAAKNNTDCLALQKAVAAFALSGPSAGGNLSGGPVPIPAQCKGTFTRVGNEEQVALNGPNYLVALNETDGTTCDGNGAFGFEVNPVAIDQLGVKNSTSSFAYFTLPSTYYKAKSFEIPIVRWVSCDCGCLCEHDQFCVMAREQSPVIDRTSGANSIDIACILYYASETPLTAERLLDKQCDKDQTPGRTPADIQKVTDECPDALKSFVYYFPDCTAQTQSGCEHLYTSA